MTISLRAGQIAACRRVCRAVAAGIGRRGKTYFPDETSSFSIRIEETLVIQFADRLCTAKPRNIRLAPRLGHLTAYDGNGARRELSSRSLQTPRCRDVPWHSESCLTYIPAFCDARANKQRLYAVQPRFRWIGEGAAD